MKVEPFSIQTPRPARCKLKPTCDQKTNVPLYKYHQYQIIFISRNILNLRVGADRIHVNLPAMLSVYWIKRVFTRTLIQHHKDVRTPLYKSRVRTLKMWVWTLYISLCISTHVKPTPASCLFQLNWIKHIHRTIYFL